MAASFVSGLQSSGAEVAFVLHSARPLIQRISAPTSRQELNWISKNLIEVLPAAFYVCNLEGVVVAFNRRATELWGTKPQARFGSHKLYRSDGTYMPHTETPMEAVLRTGDAALDMEAIIEQPDGLRLVVLVNIAPLFNESGRQIDRCRELFPGSERAKAIRERSRVAARRVATVAKVGGYGPTSRGRRTRFQQSTDANHGQFGPASSPRAPR